MSQHVSVLHSFIWLNNIPLHGYTTFQKFIHPLMDIWVVSTFWLLWIVLLWTFMLFVVLEHVFIAFVVYLGVGHRVILCLTYWVTAKLFSSSNLWGFQLLYLLADHCFLGFKKYYSHPTGCPWHLIVSLICISLKNWEYQTTWPASWEICMQVRKQQLELDVEQQTGSK